MRARGLLVRVLCLSLMALLTVGGCTGSAAETYEDMMRINADRFAHAGQNVLVERVHQNA